MYIFISCEWVYSGSGLGCVCICCKLDVGCVFDIIRICSGEIDFIGVLLCIVRIGVLSCIVEVDGV